MYYTVDEVFNQTAWVCHTVNRLHFMHNTPYIYVSHIECSEFALEIFSMTWNWLFNAKMNESLIFWKKNYEIFSAKEQKIWDWICSLGLPCCFFDIFVLDITFKNNKWLAAFQWKFQMALYDRLLFILNILNILNILSMKREISCHG